MPISPDQVLVLTEEEQADLAQAEELLDAMLKRAGVARYSIHAKMTEDGVAALRLVKDDKPYFVVCSEQVVRLMLARYKKAGWDVACVIDSTHPKAYLDEHKGGVVQRASEITLIFDVRFHSWRVVSPRVRPC